LCLAPLFAALLAAGCRQEAVPTAPARPHQGVTLRVACPGDPAAAVVQTYARGWAARAGVQVEVLRYDRPAGPQAVEAADVWVLRPAELPHWAAAGRLLPVPPQYAAREGPFAWRDLLPLYREQLLLWDRAAVGLPLLGEAPVCCYRTDLLEDGAHRRAFRQKNGWELSPPRTWEEFAAVAEYFREHGPGGKAGPSLPPVPADEGGLDRLFYTVAAGFARRAIPADEETAGRAAETFSFHYDVNTGRPRIDAPGFVYALRLLQRLQKCRPAASAAPAEAFRDGKAVLCVTDASWLPAFQKGAVRDKFSVCPMPGGGRYFDFAGGGEVAVWDAKQRGANRVPYLGAGGWLAVVPRGSANAEAAFALLAHLSGPQTSGEIVLEPRWGGPVRAPQLNRQRWDAFDLGPAQTSALREALGETLLHRGTKNPALVLRIPEQASHRAALVARLRPALAGGGADAALKEAARRWSELDQAKGPEAMRAEYRLSVGLLAR
jgi:ABC-type glycerol-3-phosphate transport system substrate-binding protein